MRYRTVKSLLAVATGTVLLLTLAPVPPAAHAAGPFATKQAAVYAPAGQYRDRFGWSVAISGNTMVVGEPDNDSSTPGSVAGAGAAYVYVRNGATWTLQATLAAPTPPPAGESDEFGWAVAIDGDTIVVGAPNYRTGGGPTGAAFVYRRFEGGWPAPTALPAETIAAGERYGSSVAIHYRTIVVGAPNDESTRGSVWPYLWTGSVWETQGTQYGTSVGDKLGSAVGVWVDTLIAGEPGDDAVDPDVGAIRVYTRSGSAWTFRQQLRAPDGDAEDYFGSPISMSGNSVIVGAPNKNSGTDLKAGKAYIFTNPGDAWEWQATLSEPVPAAERWYGTGVALDGDTAVVGAYWADSHVGTGYFYTRTGTTWTQRQKLDMSTHVPYVTLFGQSAALNNGTAVFGATLANSPTVNETGGAFAFTTQEVITGLVRDIDTGVPIPNIEMSVYVPSGIPGEPAIVRYINTDTTGRYRLAVSPGQYSVGYMSPAYWYGSGFYNGVQLYPQSTPVTVASGSTTTLDFWLQRVGAVYRFYNANAGTHFFTSSRAEKQHVIATWPHVFTYEGIAYTTDPTTDNQPLFRFYNHVAGSHFYTASVTERDRVRATWPHIFTYEGPVYNVSTVPVPGKMSVYRFYNVRNGSHFYTASATERDIVIARWSDVYLYEGPVFWVGYPGPW